MGNREKANLERIVYNQEQKRVTPIVPDHTELRREFLRRNVTTQTLQTICPEKNGSVPEKRVEDNIRRSILWIKIYWH